MHLGRVYAPAARGADARAVGVCRFHRSQFPQPYESVLVAPATKQMWADGQVGVPHRGEFAYCEPFNCWGGEYGEVPTCCDPLSNTSTPNALELFFARCTFSNTGLCDNMQPRMCVCAPYYGPPASIDPNLTYTEFADFPCVLPSSATRQGAFFRINGVTYNDTAAPLKHTPCGGVDAGEGVAYEGIGYCQCAQAPLLDPDAGGAYAPARDGAACSCPVPLLPPNGLVSDVQIVARFCNNQGTCCPFGENDAQVLVDGDPSGFVGLCPADQDGCWCYNGVGGSSCTCPVPQDWASGLVQGGGVNVRTVNLGLRRPIGFVTVTAPDAFVNQGCTALSVSVVDTLGVDPQYCEPLPLGNWKCAPADGFGTIVVVQTMETTPSCGIQVYATDDPPCGLNGNEYAGRFYAVERYRSPLLYQWPQAIEFAPYGCTNTMCMCGAGFTGANCAFGVSAYDVDVDGVVSQRVCGETVEPPRGYLGPGGCVCNPLAATTAAHAAETYFGVACEDALVYNEDTQSLLPCAGYGEAVPAQFSLGQCLDDQSDQAADPLATPLVDVVGAAQTPATFIFGLRAPTALDGNSTELRSVIAVSNHSWLVDPQQSFVVPSLVASFAVCGGEQQFPLNLTYSCADGVNDPVRAVAELFVYDLAGNYSVLCDPAAVDDTACPLGVYCARAGPPCIEYQRWQALNGSTDQLDIGVLLNAWLPCAAATRVTADADTSIAGVLNCNNAVERVIDKAVFLNTTEPLQCNGTVGPYSNVLGELYGLLYNQIGGLYFGDGPWLGDQYAMLATLVNGVRWFAGNTPVEMLDGRVMDAYIQTWITELVQQAATAPVRGARAVRGAGDYAAAHLNPYTDLLFLQSNDTSNLLVPNRGGRALCITVATPVRLVTVAAPFPIYGAQLVSEDGVCATVLNTTQAGADLNLPCVAAPSPRPRRANASRCVSDPGTYAQMLQFVLANAPARGQEAISQWNATCQFVLYYDADADLNASAVFVSGQPQQYSTLWTALTRQITVDHVLPANPPLAAAYASVAGAASQPLNLSAAADQLYLRQLWQTFLAPRKCSADWQCQLFLRHGAARCVFDQLGYTPWYNGDGTGAGVTGVEGGCYCPPSFVGGFRDQGLFCKTCLEGYGPTSATDWRLAVEYQRSILLSTGIQDAVFDSAQFPPDGDLNTTVLCRMPAYASTTRPTTLCGGRGKVLAVVWETPEVQNVWTDLQGRQYTPACTAIALNGTLMRNANTSIAIQTFSGGGLRATVVDDTFYLRQGVVYAPLAFDSCTPALCVAGATTVQCLNDVATRGYGPQWTRLLVTQ